MQQKIKVYNLQECSIEEKHKKKYLLEKERRKIKENKKAHSKMS